MRILSRYFLANYLTLFVTILASSILAIVVIEMMLNFDDILEQEEGLRGIASYLFLRIPSYYLRDLLPVSSFAAVFFGLGLPARAYEITAIKSGGIPPQRTVVPLLAGAALLSAITLVVNESLVLEASRAWNLRTNPGGEITFRQGSFWYHRGNAIYNVREANRETATLYGVSVFELSEQGRLTRSIRADRVDVEDDSRWLFHDAVSRDFDPARPAAPPDTRHLREWYRDVAEERDLAMLEASAQTLSLPNLRDYIESRAREGHDIARYRALLHSRLAEPLTVLLFALLAVPLGLTVEHTKSLATSALYGIGLISAFYVTRTTGEMFAASGFASASISPWLNLTVFSGYGAWALARVPR